MTPLYSGLAAFATIALALCIIYAFRDRGFFFPGTIYAWLIIAHIGVPGTIVGLGLAPPFINSTNDPYLTSSLLYVLTCLVGTTAGSLIGADFAQRSQFVSQRGKYTWVRPRVLIVVGLLVAIAWTIRIYVVLSDGYFQVQRGAAGELEGPFFAAIRMFEQFGSFATILLSVYTWSRPGEPSRALKTTLYLLIASEFIYWLPTGRKEDTIEALLLPVIARHLVTGYIPRPRVLVGFGLFVCLLFPLSHYYRIALELNVATAGQASASSLLDVATSSVSDAELDNSSDYESPAEVTFNRISLLEPVAAAIRLGEEHQWPLLLGQSYLDLFVTLVPRFVWPSKPGFHYGNDFGVAAGFIDASDTLTSLSVTYPGEAFLNFGWFGSFAMFGVALLFGLAYGQLRRSRDHATGTVLYVLCVPALLFIGGTFALYFGGLVKLLPVFYAICVFVRKRVA